MKKNKAIVKPAKAKFPTLLKIGYQDVKVIVDPNTKIPKKSSGQYCDKGEIVIDGMDTVKQSVNTLIHEVLHAIYYTYGMREVLDDKHEEFLVNTMANGLTQVFKDNTDLLDWIKQGLK